MPPALNAAGERRDPVTAQRILEQTCYRCHPGIGGPHGMHPVVNAQDQRWNFAHEGFAENGLGSCRTCHGANLEGTVLSRAAADRSVVCKNTQGSLSCANDDEGRLVATLSRGMPVGCGLGHQPDVA
jgi:hypothetical protein